MKKITKLMSLIILTSLLISCGKKSKGADKDEYGVSDYPPTLTNSLEKIDFKITDKIITANLEYKGFKSARLIKEELVFELEEGVDQVDKDYSINSQTKSTHEFSGKIECMGHKCERFMFTLDILNNEYSVNQIMGYREVYKNVSIKLSHVKKANYADTYVSDLLKRDNLFKKVSKSTLYETTVHGRSEKIFSLNTEYKTASSPNGNLYEYRDFSDEELSVSASRFSSLVWVGSSKTSGYTHSFSMINFQEYRRTEKENVIEYIIENSDDILVVKINKTPTAY